MYNTITSLDEFNTVKNNYSGVLYYFSTISCSVGEALEPKVKRLIKEEFSKIKFYFVDIYLTPDVAAINSVFVEPTILVFLRERKRLEKVELLVFQICINLYKEFIKLYIDKVIFLL